MPAENVIDQAIEQIADGLPVDWPRLDREARSNDEREGLKSLRILGTIADVHRSAPDAVGGDVETSTHAAVLPSGRSASDHDKTWGRYRLVEKVGEGSFGSVHRAWDPELEWEIAIKILHRHVADDQLKERLKQEGRALAQVQHPNVVRVLGIESHGDRVGLCMEFVRGETLEAGLGSKGTLSAREAMLVGEDVCRALAAVHRAGFVHRDVKARNVMRDRTGRIVLMDFGTGRQADHLRLAGPLDTAGTPVYMAPEVLAGEVASASSDVYSVGVLLYHLVTSEYPVEGRTMTDVRAAHMQGRRQSLSDRRSDLPLSFIQVVDRALAADPKQRYLSAGALLEALGAIEEKPRTRSHRTLTYLLAVLVAVAGVAAGLTGLGLLSSAFFNDKLGRSDFVAETVWDWFVWGSKASVVPVAQLMAVFLCVTVAIVLRRLVVGLLGPIAELDAALRRHLSTAVHRLGLHQSPVLASYVLVLSVTALVSAWWYFSPLLGVLLNDGDWFISTAPSENLALLSPRFIAYQQNYLLAVSGVAVVPILAWYPIARHARRGPPVNWWMVAGGAIVACLSITSYDFAYRLLVHNEFEAAKWNGAGCYIIGERGDDVLLFCPAVPVPRNKIIKANSAGLERLGMKESIFTPFVTSRRTQP